MNSPKYNEDGSFRVGSSTWTGFKKMLNSDLIGETEVCGYAIYSDIESIGVIGDTVINSNCC